MNGKVGTVVGYEGGDPMILLLLFRKRKCPCQVKCRSFKATK